MRKCEKTNKLVKCFHLISDNKVECISRRLLVSDLTSDDLDNSLFYMRHSSVMGVKYMLENCRLRINQQVTKISRQIIASLQADDTASILEQTELESPTSSILTDIAAIQYTNNAMMQFRCN
jgi:hypothetical protein